MVGERTGSSPIARWCQAPARDGRIEGALGGGVMLVVAVGDPMG
jgi:hypothetical protein